LVYQQSAIYQEIVD